MWRLERKEGLRIKEIEGKRIREIKIFLILERKGLWGKGSEQLFASKPLHAIRLGD